MEYATVKISKNTLRKMRVLKGKLMQSSGELVTDSQIVDKALDIAGDHEEELVNEKKGNWEEIKKVLGAIKISDEEAAQRIKEVREMRKSWRNFA